MGKTEDHGGLQDKMIFVVSAGETSVHCVCMTGDLGLASLVLAHSLLPQALTGRGDQVRN